MTQENRISEHDFKRLTESIADEVEVRVEKIMVNKFELLGINISTAESREAFREKMSFLTGMKMGAETMKRTAGKRFIDLLMGAIAAALAGVLGFSYWGGRPPLH